MKPADNIGELYNNLNPFLVPEMGKDDNIYVPIFEDHLNRLRTQVLAGNFEKESYYICGQSGSGKSTALNFIKNEKLEEKYSVIYLKGRELFDQSDIDIIDILLMLAIEISEILKDKKIFNAKLKKIYDKHVKKVETENTNISTQGYGAEISAIASAGAKFMSLFKIGAEFKANYQRDKETRTVTREFFNFNKSDLLNILNEIIDKYYEKFGSDKKILVIIDDLEKVRDIKQINAIFIDNRYYLSEINCKKIISVSVHLATQPLFAEVNKYFFVTKIYPNPLSVKHEDGIMEATRNLFKKAIFSRINKGVQLISDDAIELAIEKSGGIIRQYFQILYRAALQVMTLEGKSISVNDVETACSEQKNSILLQIIGKNLFNLLDNIKKTHLTNDIQDQDLFIMSLLSTQVVFYQNSQIWYDINPLIKDAIASYAAPISET